MVQSFPKDPSMTCENSVLPWPSFAVITAIYPDFADLVLCTLVNPHLLLLTVV